MSEREREREKASATAAWVHDMYIYIYCPDRRCRLSDGQNGRTGISSLISRFNSNAFNYTLILPFVFCTWTLLEEAIRLFEIYIAIVLDASYALAKLPSARHQSHSGCGLFHATLKWGHSASRFVIDVYPDRSHVQHANRVCHSIVHCVWDMPHSRSPIASLHLVNMWPRWPTNVTTENKYKKKHGRKTKLSTNRPPFTLCLCVCMRLFYDSFAFRQSIQLLSFKLSAHMRLLHTEMHLWSDRNITDQIISIGFACERARVLHTQQIDGVQTSVITGISIRWRRSQQDYYYEWKYALCTQRATRDAPTCCFSFVFIAECRFILLAKAICHLAMCTVVIFCGTA